jgi:hypothetical protein
MEEAEQKEEGLASVMGKWEDFDELGDILADIPSMRENGGFSRSHTLSGNEGYSQIRD